MTIGKAVLDLSVSRMLDKEILVKKGACVLWTTVELGKQRLHQVK